MATHEMNSKKKTGGPSPEMKSNVFTYFTWQWVQPFITLGNKKAIQMEDVYDLLPRENTAYCERIWNKHWDNQIKKTGKPPSVLSLFYVSAGREMIFSILACPFWLAAVVAQVFVLRALVEVAEESNEHLQWWRGFLLVFGMLITSNIQSVCQHYTFTAGQKSGMKIKSAMSMAIFNKLMKLKVVALSGTSAGKILNLLMNDTQKLLDACTFFGFTIFGIVDSVVVAALAITEIGVSALPGVAVIVLANFFQVATAQGIGFIRKRAVKLTDARVRTIQEILSGVRVVKYNGWTTAFLGRIQELRKVEMQWIRRAAFLRASSSALRDGVAPTAALMTFTTYVLSHGGNFSAAKAFTVLGLYSILVRVFSIAPTGAQAIWESSIAVKRLQQLLDLPEGNCSSSEETMDLIRKIYPEASLAVSDGTFSWQLEHGDDTEATAHVAGRRSFSVTKQVHVDAPDATLEKAASDNGRRDEENDGKNVATLKNINMAVSKGQLTAIIGPVGSGKSSLLQAVLGEMEIVKGGFLLDGTVSYAPQQPWIINDTIKNNILFSSEWDEARYKRTVTACALDHDIKTMPAGEDTEIGERGVNISGGQKARISLARACYNASTVVLLDDPLAAVDVPTARHLMDHVLSGVLKGRTVVLVTHNKSALELCDKVFFMNNGELKEVELEENSIQDILQKEEEHGIEGEGSGGYEGSLVEESSKAMEEQRESGLGARKSSTISRTSDLIEHLAVMRNTSSDQGSKRTSSAVKEISASHGDDDGADAKEAKQAAIALGGLTVKEDRVEGQVTFKTYVDFCRGSGLWLWAVVLFLMAFGQAVRVLTDFWISIWVNHKYNLTTRLYLAIYAVWVGGMIFFNLSRGLIFTEAAVRAAKSMHRLMAESVLRSPQLFFDQVRLSRGEVAVDSDANVLQNPVGRIMNRFSKDQSMVDELLPWTGQGMFENLTAVLGVIVLVGVIMPYFLLTLPPFMFILWYCQRRYVAVSRELKRLDGLSRSPIYAQFSQVLAGVTSVRAYGVQAEMHDHFRDLLDMNNRCYIMFVHTSRWLGIRLDFGAAMCLTTSALLSVLLRHQVNPGYIGVVLIQSLQLTGFFQYGVRLVADTENYFTSVERNQAYSRLPSEADPNSPPGLISDEWPEKGKIDFVDYSMTYRVDLQPVLNNLTFTVLPQEKIGILGRTGAGKSSLAAALFRMVENTSCSGSILIDDVDIKLVGLDDLRLRLSIIPQDPVLFRGTVRLNLDPFHRHTDMEIYEALKKVELTAKIKSLDAGLDSTVSENGENFSVGQRQLLCLARSLLRKSKIIVMDEATAAVDGETDQLIQKTMKTVFSDCTVLTIAHRIDTVIDCDRVLVLAKGGRIAEFDSPLNLLRHAEQVSVSDDATTTESEHVFAGMVSQAGPAVAAQLREAAEAAEIRRQRRTGSDSQRSTEEVLSELKAAGAHGVQLDEPTLVLDLEPSKLGAFKKAYDFLGADFGAGILVETYFADIPAETYKAIVAIDSISALGVDLVRGSKTLDVIKEFGLPGKKKLLAGVVDGRNIWANDLAASLTLLEGLVTSLGKDKVLVSTSCSLLHTAVDLKNETKLDDELKSWLAFAAQKVLEVVALANALKGNKDEEFFAANAAAQASRRASPRVHDEAVKKATKDLETSTHRRSTPVVSRLEQQQKKLNLPILPTTTIGSFPQTPELRRVRREFKSKKIAEADYIKAIETEITNVVKLQESLDLDVLVHGEPERNDMVEYFGEQLNGFVFTANGWVQSYGSRCVKPPIIFGDVSRPKSMTVFWSKYAQSLTSRPMKGMLTGPVTILNWSFVRNDQPRSVTCLQIALAIKDEVEDLEANGITVIQIDEAALREGLPLRKSEQAAYQDWAVHGFRITTCGVKDTTQIHTHMCYSNFNDIIHSIIDMDADVITIENSRSDEKLLSVFREGVKYAAGIGPGVYDIHSPRIPPTEELVVRARKMLAVLESKVLWINPDCGLKTRKYPEVVPALTNMVAATKELRAELAATK